MSYGHEAILQEDNNEAFVNSHVIVGNNEEDLSSVLTGHTENKFVKISNGDGEIHVPCPWCESMFGASIVYQCCCCCFWNENDRRKCAIQVLYSKIYFVLYFLIIAITLTLLIYDFSQGIEKIERQEPGWFVALDIVCVLLMVVDVFVQILANPIRYWKSATNVFDFIVVAICVIGVPVYFYVPQSDIILTIILLLRFGAQLLRIVMIFKHQRRRKEYIDATENAIVDFSTFQDSVDIARNQGIADDGDVIVFDPKSDLTDNIRDMTPEWKVIEKSKTSRNSSNPSITPLMDSNERQSMIQQITPFMTPDNIIQDHYGTNGENGNEHGNENGDENNNEKKNDKKKRASTECQSLIGAINDKHNKGYESFGESDRDITNSSRHSLLSEKRNKMGNQDDNDKQQDICNDDINDHNNEDNNGSKDNVTNVARSKRILSDDNVGITPVVI